MSKTKIENWKKKKKSSHLVLGSQLELKGCELKDVQVKIAFETKSSLGLNYFNVIKNLTR